MSGQDQGPQAASRADCGCGGECGPCRSNFGAGPTPLGPPSRVAKWPLLHDLPKKVGDLTRVPDMSIVLSAGPVSGDKSCDPSNQDACSLYRLKIVSGEVWVHRLRKSDHETGFIEPALSPNGAKVVYLERSGNRSERLSVQSVSPFGSGPSTAFERKNERGPQWPDWLNDDRIVFNRHNNDETKPRFQDPRLFVAWASGTPEGHETLLKGDDDHYCSDADVFHDNDPHRVRIASHRKAQPKFGDY